MLFRSRPKEIIDETVLYQVKRIMNDIYAENLPLDEALLKSGVMEFFEKKKLFLSDLKKKYGGDYAGSKVAAKLYQDFSAILKSSDSLPIFNEIINRADSLEDNVEILDQLEGFYKEGSHQQKNYQDALELIEWYNDNRKFEDLSCLDSVIEAMQAIVNLEMPFQKMNDLVNLVFKASELRDQVLQDKYQSTVRRLEQDRKSISHELEDVMALKLTDDRRSRIQDKADELFAQYDEWLSSLLKSTPNMDSYIRASSSAVSGFREFIASVMRKDTSTTVRSKRVSIIECVPAVSKKVTSADDVEKVLDAIRTKLLAELENNDEVNLH